MYHDFTLWECYWHLINHFGLWKQLHIWQFWPRIADTWPWGWEGSVGCCIATSPYHSRSYSYVNGMDRVQLWSHDVSTWRPCPWHSTSALLWSLLHFFTVVCCTKHYLQFTQSKPCPVVHTPQYTGSLASGAWGAGRQNYPAAPGYSRLL